MPTTYDDCTQDVLDIARDIMNRHYRDLLQAGVTVRYLFARNPDGPAIKVHGVPAAASVKVNGLQHRKEGLTDCTVKICAEWWEQHDKLQCEALIDHELAHILVAFDENGAIEADDVGRPKIRLKPHDFEIGGFFDIVQRHGSNAVEAQAVVDTAAKFREMEPSNAA